MKVAVVVPIKSTSSTRVPGKNFRTLGNSPLYIWTLYSLHKATYTSPCTVDIFIDSDSPTVFDKVNSSIRNYSCLDSLNLSFHHRSSHLALDSANGNNLMSAFCSNYPAYTHFLQVHITTPFTSPSTYSAIFDSFFKGIDSVYTACDFTGWVRKNNIPLNYDCSVPNGLPRSQDALLTQETTDAYGFSKPFFDKNLVRTNSSSQPVLC